MKSVSQMSLASFSAILMLALADSAASATYNFNTTKISGDDCSAQVNNFINGLFNRTSFTTPSATTTNGILIFNSTVGQGYIPGLNDTINATTVINGAGKILSNCPMNIIISVGDTLVSLKDKILNISDVNYWPQGLNCVSQLNVKRPANLSNVYCSDYSAANRSTCASIVPVPSFTCNLTASIVTATILNSYLDNLKQTLGVTCAGDVKSIVNAVNGSLTDFTSILNTTITINAKRFNDLQDPVCYANSTDCEKAAIFGTYLASTNYQTASKFNYSLNQTLSSLLADYKNCSAPIPTPSPTPVSGSVKGSVIAFSYFIAIQLFF